MFELIETLWCLSPLVLIPLCIGLSSKNKKLKSFIERLYIDNRISWREKLSMYVEPHRRQQPMEDDHRPQKGMPYLPQDIDRYRQNDGRRTGGALNYPGMNGQTGAPVFKDEARKVQPLHGAQTYVTPQNGNVQQPVYISPAEQNRMMQQNVAKTTGQPVQQNDADISAPHHHHDGVDLVKHDTAKTTAAENTAAAAVQQTVKTGVQQSAQTAQAAVAQNANTNTQQNVQQPTAAVAQNAGTNTQQPVRQPAAAAVQQTAQNAGYYQGGGPVYPQAGYNGYPQRVYNNGQPLPQWAQKRPAVVKPPKPKREKKHYSPAAVITGIGITFVVLAGIIFSTAFWVNMSNWTRVGVLAGQAALFFGMFFFTHKKLKIEGTAAAVYILGSVFTTISYLTIGYFGLMGAWFGMEGGGMMLFLALGALMMTFFSAAAMKVFKKPFCEYAASISLAISGTLLLAHFANYFQKNYSAFSLLITAAGTIFTAVYFFMKSKGKEISKPVKVTHNIVRLAYLIIGLPVLIYDIARSVDDMGWTVFGWGVCMIYMGECLWHAIRLKSKNWLSVHAVLVLAGMVSLYFNIADYPTYALIAVIISMLGGWAYLFLEKKGKLLFDAREVYVVLRVLITISAAPLIFMHTYKDPLCWAVAGLLYADFTGVAIFRKKQAYLVMQCGVVLNLLYEMYLHLTQSRTLPDTFELYALITLLIGIAGTAVYRTLEHKDKLLVKANGINIFMRIVMGLPAFAVIINEAYRGRVTELGTALCLLPLAELTFYSILKRRQNELFFQFVYLLFAVNMFIPEDISFYGADHLKVFAMAVWGICVVGTALYSVLRYKGKSILTAGKFIVYARAIAAVIGAVAVSNDLQFSDHGEFSWVSWLLVGGMAAEMLIYAIIKKHEGILGIHAFYLSCILFEVCNLLGDMRFFALAVTAFIAVMTMIYNELDVRGKLRFNAARVLVVMRGLFGTLAVIQIITCFTEWNYDIFGICAVLALETLYYGIRRRKEAFIGVHALFLTLMFSKLGEFTGKYDYLIMMLFGVAAVGTFVYYRLHKAEKLLFDAKRVLIGVRITYAVLFLPMVFMDLIDFSWQTLAMFGLLALEGLYYGISMKKEAPIGIHAISLTGAMWCVAQYIGNAAYFPLMACGVAAAGTLAYTLLGKAGKRRFDTPFVVAGVRSFYSIMCLALFVKEWSAFTWISVVVWSVLAAEATYYTLTEKKKLLLNTHSIVMLLFFTVAANFIGGLIPGKFTGLFIFAMLTAAMLVVYRIVPALYSKISDTFMTAVLFICGLWLMIEQALPYGVITMLMIMIIFTVNAFDDDHFLRYVFRVILPLPALITAGMLAEALSYDYDIYLCRPLSMAICAGVLCIAAYILSFGLSSADKYAMMKYSTEAGAGIALLMAHSDKYSLAGGPAAGITIMAVSAALLAVIHLSKKTFHAAIPMFALFMGAKMAAHTIWVDPMTEGNAVIVFSIFMTAVLAVVSRLMFPDSLIKKTENKKYQLDIPQLGIFLCVLSCHAESSIFSGRARLFIALLEMAVFSANLIRRNNSGPANRSCMTLAAGFGAAALIARPFMAFENAMITTKIILVIIVAFGLAVKKIWAENEKVSREFSQAVFMAAFLLLIFDGLTNQSLTNSLIVLSVSLALLIYSFIRKTRRWFLVSAVSLLGLTLYITGDFLAAIAWWAYLLIAGILLIVVAAMTEYFRQRSAKNPQEERFFIDWKW
ncbi:hypothetical protein [uncultured Ruminococcus sp.]|uniref:hypothetical protein n=1 Tax=uncultured Ruminococcus sp. TaxID=165186 RepID=UPI0025FCF58E|nr:hypothetical protein [uncultured Ruminococcus sp.]